MLMNAGEEGGYLWAFCFQARHPALPPSAPQRGGHRERPGCRRGACGAKKHPFLPYREPPRRSTCLQPCAKPTKVPLGGLLHAKGRAAMGSCNPTLTPGALLAWILLFSAFFPPLEKKLLPCAISSKKAKQPRCPSHIPRAWFAHELHIKGAGEAVQGGIRPYLPRPRALRAPSCTPDGPRLGYRPTLPKS